METSHTSHPGQAGSIFAAHNNVSPNVEIYSVPLNPLQDIYNDSNRHNYHYDCERADNVDG